MVVGSTATAVHVAIAIALVEGAGVSPFWANIPAFLVAFVVSYCGNLCWTFQAAGDHLRRVPRFLSVTLLAFGLNQLIVHVVVDRLDLDYRLALALVVSLVPPAVFFASRRFAFSAGSHPAGSPRQT